MVAAPNPCLAPGRPWAGPPSEKSVVLTGQGSGSLVVRTMPRTHPVKQAGESMESGSATRQTRVVMEGAAADQALAPLPQLDSTSSDDSPNRVSPSNSRNVKACAAVAPTTSRSRGRHPAERHTGP